MLELTSDSIELKIAKAALKKMFNGQRYSICPVDDVIKMLGIHVNTSLYYKLRCLHCIDFWEMDDELKLFSFNGTLELLWSWTVFIFDDFDEKMVKMLVTRKS